MRADGRAAAYGRRVKPMFHARRAVNRTLRAVAAPLATGRADYLTVWPPPESRRSLSDVAARVNWYLPNLAIPVHVPTRADLALDAESVPYLDPSLVHIRGWTADRPAGRPWYLLPDVRPTTIARAGARLRRSAVVDPNLSLTSEYLGYRRVHAALTASVPVTGKAFGAFLDATPRGRDAFVLGTGPSAGLVDPASVTADVRIVCNSTVRNAELIARLQPTVIVCADPVFHFGPSRYAATFREDLARALDLCDAFVVTGEYFAALLEAHYPRIARRVVPVAFAGSLNIPTATDPRVSDSGNILTLLMLPLAFALADVVDVAGCDGRRPSENYFWQHSPLTQYSDELMQTVFDAHPSFFRHRSYTDYYERHCQLLEELISLGESRGKQVRGVTPSWIPALARRGAPVPAA
ncbi:MAG: hypothetical protein ABR520_08720 [Mycobacteriales bacterium]|nr:hypothetical protein [Frankia sp.]